jgi:isopentenyl-diphosphate delta-isomerase
MVAQKEELIVFVDESGEPTGETGTKLESHNLQTKLHLGFSCYIFNEVGKFLVTQRAQTKKMLPGTWTNSIGGHVMPGESMEDAIKRRAKSAVGLSVYDISCILPSYRYKTPPYDGVVENEFCPVYVARTKGRVTQNADEVAAHYWASWTDYVVKMEHEPQIFSYWAKNQYAKLNNSPTFNAYLSSLSQEGKSN